MAKRDQLDLFGAAEAHRAGAPVALRFVPVDAPGRLGIAALDADPASLRAEHKVSVLVAACADPAPVVERAASVEDVDVRHALVSDGRLGSDSLRRHAVALAADARFGRRSVVLADDDAIAALLVASALVELGASVEEAADAVALPSHARAALDAFAHAGSEPRRPDRRRCRARAQ